MRVSQAAALCLEYHKSNSRQNTIRGYGAILSKFCQQFADKNLKKITSNDVLSFLNRITDRQLVLPQIDKFSEVEGY